LIEEYTGQNLTGRTTFLLEGLNLDNEEGTFVEKMPAVVLRL
jgi:hypothetical protein